MIRVIAVEANEHEIRLDTKYNPEDIKEYLKISKKLYQNDIFPLNKVWKFHNRTFKNLEELAEVSLNSQEKTIDELEDTMSKLGIIEEINFKKKYIQLHKDIPNEIVIRLFKYMPTFWHLEIRRGSSTWRNISNFAENYFGSKSVEELYKISKKYLDEVESE